MGRDFAPTVADLDATIEEKRSKLGDVRAAILAKRRERDRIEEDLRRLEIDRTAFTAVIGDLERAREAVAKIAGVVPKGRRLGESLTAPVTMPLEGPANDAFKLLGRAHIRSESNRQKFYIVEVRLYGQRIVLTCDCARFTFSRGEYASGKKQHCKHIDRFKATTLGWRDLAYQGARAQGVVGRIVYSEGVYDYECVVAGRSNREFRRVAIS